MSRFDDNIRPPSVLIFDWHGTLVDTHDAMFSAMEEMLPQLEELGLVEQQQISRIGFSSFVNSNQLAKSNYITLLY